MGEIFTLNSAHNFGIYTKSGKRTIFQIDFSCKRISLIERGKISKSYDFSNLDQYDSEENLHIVIRFRNNKVLEFDADTAEEKYTICRLLGIVLNQEPVQTNGIETRDNGVKNLSTKKQTLKEGILDKKGNTKIPTWSRRRLQVCPGEFSYYKPGDEVALNLVQLWENSTSVNTNGQSGFVVAVRDRSYYFRLPSEKGVNTEQERDKWVQAFKQASQRKRATFLLLEMSKNSEYVNTRQDVPLPSIPSEDEDEVCYYNQNTSRSTMSSSDSNSSREILEGLEVINELDEVLNDESASSSRNAQRNISLSVVEKTSPMLVSPSKNRARPPAIYNMKTSFKSEDDAEPPTYDFIPEPDYSPPPSPTSESSSGFGSLGTDKHSSGVYKQVITRRDSDNDNRVINNRVSGSYNQVIKNDAPNKRSSGEYTKAIKPGAGAVNVMSNFTEIPKLRRVGSKDTNEILDKDVNASPREKSPRDSNQPMYTNEKISVKQMQASIENTYINEVKDKQEEKSDKLPSPRDKSKFPVPAPSAPRRAPPPPVCNIPPAPPPVCAPAPPAIPPPLSQVKQMKGKLKQVHWSRTPKPLVQNSIWERPRDMTPRLNLSLLEEQFSLKEKDTPPTPGPKSPAAGKQQLLVDAKRAQILDIFMSGLKNEGTRKLVDVLNCVTEDDSFPAEKLTTIRRYQPTEDEIDMYKAYAHKKHELHPVDQFMLELCEIPFLNIRIDICLTLWEFPWQFESTCQLVDQVHAACDELLNSQMLVLVLEYLLAIGNHLNRNWSESHVSSGFQVTSLDKILSVRGKDTGYTLIHFLVEQLRMSDPGLLQWTESVQMVKKCEQISVKSVAAESEVLKCDLSKVKKHLKTLKSKPVYCSRQDNKFQQDAQVTSMMNGQRSCFRKLLVPLVTGNTMYALFGINWGGNEEKADVIKTDNTTVEDVRQQILNKADYLYSENKVVALYDFLRMHQHSEDDEILWRLARAAVDKGKLPEYEDMKRDLYYEAYDYIKKALELNPRNFAVHKWYAILLDYTGELEGNKQRLINAVQVKEHFQKAIELNPKDATSIHSLGQWCFTFAAMPWYQRKLAAVIYASPPTSTFEEALTYFLQAEETEPNFYSMNLLMLGKTYMRLKDAEMALTYLTRCINHPVKTPDDKQANDEAGCLFKMLTQKKPPSDK